MTLDIKFYTIVTLTILLMAMSTRSYVQGSIIDKLEAEASIHEFNNDILVSTLVEVSDEVQRFKVDKDKARKTYYSAKAKADHRIAVLTRNVDVKRSSCEDIRNTLNNLDNLEF